MTESPTPKYQQLASELAAAIRRGDYPAGSQLPPVRALATQRRVDVATVSRAYQVLAQQGLVDARPRRGTVVLPHNAPPAVDVEAPLALRCIGSHDFCLDVLARQLRARGIDLRHQDVGSIGGLRALQAGRAELAGLHLLDDDGADYNQSAVRRVLGGRDVRLITLVEREQGLIVARGNPRRIKSGADLGQPGLRLVNRQAGSGTRLLLERILQQHGLVGSGLLGYERVVETHLAAAAAVAGGSADVALGIHAAARALDLAFEPLVLERYDLALLAEHMEAPWFGPLLETLAAPAFRVAVEALGGYDAARSAWMRRVT